MEAFAAQLEEMRRALNEERAQRLATEERLRVAEARIADAATNTNHPQPAHPPNFPAPAPAPSGLVLAKPKPFDGTRGALAEAFMSQIGLHTITFPERFPTDSTKVAFAVSFLTDYAATWAQPYLERLIGGHAIAFQDFLDDFSASFYDHNGKQKAEIALRGLRQTGTVSAYTQTFNMHARAIGWADGPLMSLYQQGLKEKVQLAVVMSNIEFGTLQKMQALALRAGQTIKGITNNFSVRPASSTNPNPDPNAMDLSAFQQTSNRRNPLSDAERARRVQLNLCFRCGQEGHISRGCSNGRKEGRGRQQPSSSARISALQAEINILRASQASSTPDNASSSKNGGAQV